MLNASANFIIRLLEVWPPELPNSAVNIRFRFMETKKAWEFLLLAHPCCQAFALPQFKDKQRSQPTPSDYMYN